MQVSGGLVSTECGRKTSFLIKSFGIVSVQTMAMEGLTFSPTGWQGESTTEHFYVLLLDC
ncbi:hypothetical protein QL093DRAFT_2238930 [Fusarium oxysporum]|nr:hypothetical protein QL093DRAFT_2238930 [Fusarium oxysporum]